VSRQSEPVQGLRYLTHMLRFRDDTARPAIANFFASGVLALKEKLGPFLWQFPPNYSFEPARLNRFLALLPRDTREAATLASQHDARVKRPWFDIRRQHLLRHAIEIRHPSFASPDFIKTLREGRVALVISDSVAGWPYDICAFTVLRRCTAEPIPMKDSTIGRVGSGDGPQGVSLRMRSFSRPYAPVKEKFAMCSATSTMTKRFGRHLMPND
jgi:uncharacterized protein YecE (DUF72 family)